MEMPFTLKDTEVSASCSIGIALFPDDGGDYETLMRQADVEAAVIALLAATI